MLFAESCVLCSCPGAIFCQSCAEYDNHGILLKARWYCGPLCKHTDDFHHMKECPLMATDDALFKRAQTAGKIAQALFYVFVQNTWAYDMSNVRIVRDQEGDIVTIEVIAGPGGFNAGPGGESTCERHAGGWLVKFPHATFNDGDQEAKHTLLADRNSIWAFVFMHAAVQALFADLVHDSAEDIKEVVHFALNNSRRLIEHKGRFGFSRSDRQDVVYSDHTTNGDFKGVYSITLKDGTKIALDLAGAQYNLPHTTVLRWPVHLNVWGNAMKYCVPFRSHYYKHAEKMSSYRCITRLTVVMEQTGYFNNLVTNLKRELGFHPTDLVNMDPQDFHEIQPQLIGLIHKCFQDHCDKLDRGVHPNCVAGAFDLRHPKVVAKLPNPNSPSTNDDLPVSLPRDIGDMKKFGWSKLSKFIQMPSHEVKYHEKKKAKALLLHRCAYKMPGDWKLVFLPDTLPSSKVPTECVSENPCWKRE